jgi:hypothetical protein
VGAKIYDMGSGDWAFYCPGCGYLHSFRVNGDKSRPQWSWNGSVDRPSFTPSLLVNKDFPAQRCHLYMTDGKIQFLADCFHELKNATVEIPDWDSRR